MKAICISGKARHGKDTAAHFMRDILEQKGKRVLIAHYADLLKYICKTFFKWNGKKDEEGRTLLQYVGTDIIREQEPNYWVDFIIGILKLFDHEWDYVIIPDCRFPNEIDAMRDAGFKVTSIKIIRDNFIEDLTKEQKQHISETALDDYVFDIVIHNTTMAEFLQEIENIYGFWAEI